jgi:hypothetical protein
MPPSIMQKLKEILKRLLFPSYQDAIQHYLNQSVDHADLERRMRIISQGNKNVIF